MTQTVSFREKFNSGFALFKWELKSSIKTLIVYSLISGVFISIVLTLCIMVGITGGQSSSNDDFEQTQKAVTVFQYICAYFVFFLNAVFTIVYTIRIYSYLHNKRKADLYGSMPISRRTFYISKTVSAYLLSVIPAMFFFGMISVISVCFGVAVTENVAMLYVQLLIGAIACISFYGLLAVCCGTTLNTVLSFIAINFAYPISTLYIKGTLKAFLWGMPTSQYNNSFIMKALNPMAAYDGKNIIYWLIFTAVCLFLGIWLVKKRKAECAQTSFAFYLPCYIVELLIAFIIGMFVGVIFGSVNVLLNGYLGFVFGFILGSIPALTVTHLILYKGFAKFWKSAAIYGGLAVTVVALMAICNFDVFGYNSYIPADEDIKSAGLIDLDYCYYSKTKGALGLADMASDDYDDSENIELITRFHRGAINFHENEPQKKYRSIWTNMLLSSISSEFTDSGYCIAYRLNNGTLKYRYFSERIDGYEFSYDSSVAYASGADKILNSDEYFINYSTIMNADPNDINSLDVLAKKYPSTTYINKITIKIDEGSKNAQQVAEDRKKILEAYRKDVKEVGRHKDMTTDEESYVCTLKAGFNLPDYYKADSLFDRFAAILSNDRHNNYEGNVSSDYTNTLNALKEIGVLNSDNTVNKNGDYYLDVEK